MKPNRFSNRQGGGNLKDPVSFSNKESSQPWLVQTRYVYFLEEGVAPKRGERLRVEEGFDQALPTPSSRELWGVK